MDTPQNHSLDETFDDSFDLDIRIVTTPEENPTESGFTFIPHTLMECTQNCY